MRDVEKENKKKLIVISVLLAFFLIILIILQYSIDSRQILTTDDSKPSVQLLTNTLSESLDGKLLDVYSFITSLLSLFGIYFAIIQFVVEMSSQNNTFFAVNYVRVVLDESNVVKILKSKFFYGLLGLLVILPVIYRVFKDYLVIILSKKSNIVTSAKVIVYGWNSIVLLLLLIFIISLYIGFSKIWDITTTPDIEKRKKCYNKIEFLLSLLFDNYKNYEENEYGPDSLNIFFDRVLDMNSRMRSDNNEQSYFLSNLLAKVDFKEVKRKDEFISRYLDIVNTENVKLIPIEGDDKAYYYPFLDKISENAKLDKETSTFNKVHTFLNKQDEIIPYRLADFIINIFNQCSYEMVKDLVCIYLNKCKCNEPLLVRLLRLGSKGERKDFEDNIGTYFKVFYIWVELFSQYEKNKIELIFPENGILNLKRSGDYIYLSNNIFVYASIYYKNKKPNSKILKNLYNSLNKIGKAYYDGELEMTNDEISEVNKDIYDKLVRNYEDTLSS